MQAGPRHPSAAPVLQALLAAIDDRIVDPDQLVDHALGVVGRGAEPLDPERLDQAGGVEESLAEAAQQGRADAAVEVEVGAAVGQVG